MNSFPLFEAFLKTKIFLHKDAQMVKIMVWCLLKASKSDNMVLISEKQYKLFSGQFTVGQYVAEKELNIAGKTVYRKLLKLKGLGLVSTKVVKKFTLVTVLHYDSYKKLTPSDFSEGASIVGGLYLDSTSREPLKLVSELDSKEKKKSPKKNYLPETKPLVTFFCNKHKERFKKPYIVAWGKDCFRIKQLLEGGLTFTSITKAIERFMADTDEWLVENNAYSIGMFASRINRYVLPDTKKTDHLELEIR